MDEVFESLVGVCGELGAKLSNIDTLEYQIDGKSKNTWKMWGVKFHVRIIKDQSGIHVEIYDTSRFPTDIFIKELYNRFTKYASTTKLVVDSFDRVFLPLRENDVRYSGYERDARIEESGNPLPGEGAPAMVADIPDDNSKVLPMTGSVCEQCGAAIDADSTLCSKCSSRTINCPACGHVSEKALFCIKCGRKLA